MLPLQVLSGLVTAANSAPVVNAMLGLTSAVSGLHALFQSGAPAAVSVSQAATQLSAVSAFLPSVAATISPLAVTADALTMRNASVQLANVAQGMTATENAIAQLPNLVTLTNNLNLAPNAQPFNALRTDLNTLQTALAAMPRFFFGARIRFLLLCRVL